MTSVKQVEWAIRISEQFGRPVAHRMINSTKKREPGQWQTLEKWQNWTGLHRVKV
jgi:hypothetical protein